MSGAIWQCRGRHVESEVAAKRAVYFLLTKEGSKAVVACRAGDCDRDVPPCFS